MAQNTLKGLVIIALAGTTLSGCSLVGSVADTAWGGTKTVVKWVSAPVRYVLRDTPEAETEFVGVETDSELAEADVETETVLVAEATDTETIKIEPLSETVTTVSESTVVAAQPISHSTQTTVETTSYYQSASYQSDSYQSASMTQMASAADFSSNAHYSIQNLDGSGAIHFVRLKGESKMSDWMGCNNSANGYWITNGSGGHINPEFEVCMRNMDYVLKTELSSYDTAELGSEKIDLKIEPATVTTVETITMAGAKPDDVKSTTSASYVALPATQSGALPDKF